jgi:demethylspheroidene O-methyltransferase
LPCPAATPSWRDRVLAWRDRLVAQPSFQRWAASFPLTRPIARHRARALFDLVAGFVYSQTMVACLRLDLFAILAARPQDAASVALRTGLTPTPPSGCSPRPPRSTSSSGAVAGGMASGPLGAPLVGNEGLAALIEHHALLYEDLRDPWRSSARGGGRRWPATSPTPPWTPRSRCRPSG